MLTVSLNTSLPLYKGRCHAQAMSPPLTQASPVQGEVARRGRAGGVVYLCPLCRVYNSTVHPPLQDWVRKKSLQ